MSFYSNGYICVFVDDSKIILKKAKVKSDSYDVSYNLNLNTFISFKKIKSIVKNDNVYNIVFIDNCCEQKILKLTQTKDRGIVQKIYNI